jgi:hypothetical protein
MPGGNAAVMSQDGLEGEDGAAIEPLARFGSLHDVPTFGLRELYLKSNPYSLAASRATVGFKKYLRLRARDKSEHRHHRPSQNPRLPSR